MRRGDADSVFIPTRKQTGRPLAAFISLNGDQPEVVRTFSVTRAAQITYGRPEPQNPFAPKQSDGDPELDPKKNLYKKKLLAMKARSDSSDNFERSFQQEDIQEWLDNLQYRLYEARQLASGVPRSERRSTLWNLHEKETDNNSKDKNGSRSRSHNKPRSRSICGLTRVVTDSGTALTDGEYLEQLQKSLHKASISSLHDRLAERQLKDETQSTIKSVRPKTAPKLQIPTKNRRKTTRSTCGGSTAESVCSSQASVKSKTSLKIRVVSPEVNIPAQSSFLEMNCEKVDDIYRAAETLILPPVRRECGSEDVSSRVSSPIPLLAGDSVEIEDYWDSKE